MTSEDKESAPGLVDLLDPANTAASLRALADAMRADAGRRTHNKRPELADLPKSALNGMAELFDQLANDLPWPAVEQQKAQAGPSAVGGSEQFAPGEIERIQAKTLSEEPTPATTEEPPTDRTFVIAWPISPPAPHDDSDDAPEGDESPKA